LAPFWPFRTLARTGQIAVNDLCQVAGPEAVRVCITRAALLERPEAEAETVAQPNGPADESEANGLDEEIARLAALREADYLSQRREAANRLGWPVSALDRLVAAARPADENTPAKGRRLELPEPVQWPEPVDGAALVAELKAAIRKYEHPAACREGALLRGHEFHYASIEAKGERDPPFAFVQDAYGGGERAEGNRRGKVSGSFFHVIATDERNGMGPRSIQ
jgi:hypothetical protein